MATAEIETKQVSPDGTIPGLKAGRAEQEAYEIFCIANTNRIIYPGQQNAKEKLEKTVAQWKERDVFWGFYTGVFDITHPNHYLAAIRARILVAKAYAQTKGVSFSELDLELKSKIITSNNIALLISIDGDEYLSSRKGHKHGKVNTKKPTQPWGSRALNMSNIMLPVEDGLYRPVADIITSHDTISYPGQIFESHLNLGEYLKPDCWMVASSDPQNALDIAKLDINTKIMNLDVGTIIDPFTNEPYSTSDTIARLITS